MPRHDDTLRLRGTEKSRYEHDSLTERIIGCAVEVHRHLGPGLIESSYEQALCIELTSRRLSFQRQIEVPVFYKGELIGAHRLDLVVEERVVVELKSVDRLLGLHQAQALMYMRLLKLSVGLVLNFNTGLLKDGIRRLAL